VVEVALSSIRETARKLKARDISPVELVRECIDRIEKIDSKVHAFGTLTAESAMSEARVAEAEIMNGRYLGPLHGIPVAYKDLIDVAGVRGTAGSRLFGNRIAPADSTVTARLKRAGAVGLGKLAMGELACTTSATALFDCPRNPWNLDHFAGDSSSGSAVAVSAGLVLAALGSDEGGSIRTPAAACGIVGLKPSFGRVSRTGVMLGSVATSHIGPLARTVYDAALVLQAIAGYDELDALSSNAPVPCFTQTIEAGVSGLRIGVARDIYRDPRSGVSEPVAVAMDGAIDKLARLGAQIVECDLSFFRPARVANIVLISAETFGRYREAFKADPQIFGEQFRMFMYLCCAVTGADYAQALRIRTMISRAMTALFQQVDVLLTPTTPRVAPPLSAIADSVQLWTSMLSDGNGTQVNWTSPFSLTGQPAISLPCGMHTGLPIGLQFSGRFMDEARIPSAANAFEGVSGFRYCSPPLETTL
jgi:aspartyl-tRNA(Asn)/glutamyl-tRNA(Gln) amidotransferase subunit A